MKENQPLVPLLPIPQPLILRTWTSVHIFLAISERAEGD